ncbi:stabilin-2-like [Brachyhypopomus gauderio]|uniref:stabilin-2-like n=1 Tax=Brachyhypopomus gauderio TaxID=698409 RepID=UPI004041F768
MPHGPTAKALRAKWDSLKVCDGLLYRVWEQPIPGEMDLATSSAAELERERVLAAVDEAVGVGHFGVTKTLRQLQQRFYWPGCRNDVELFVHCCNHCTAKKGSQPHSQAPLQTLCAGVPMERVAMDILGPFPASDTVQETTGFRLAQLMFGRELHTPVELAFGAPPDTDSGNQQPHQFVQQLQQHLMSAHQMKNGGCHKEAVCMMTGPAERNCTCRNDLIGDGMTCKSNVMQVKSKERSVSLSLNSETRPELSNFFYSALLSDTYFLQWRGPNTVFAPNNKAFSKSEYQKNKKNNLALVLHHVVSCRTLLPEDLMQPRNLTTLSGETLTISYSEGSIYINNKAKVVYSDQESNNGIFYEIDTLLIPPDLQNLNEYIPASLPELKEVADEHGFKTFFKLMEDTDVIKQVQDRLHQPVTLFLPTDTTMSALPQEQKDFLFGLQNRAQLKEYLEYHVIRDMKVQPAELIDLNSMKTLQGSDISVSCVGEDQIGDLYVNDKSCRIVKRNLKFIGGYIYGIDCLLTPPSLGGRCDQKDTVDITMPCRYCGMTISSDCPSTSKPKGVQRCDLSRRFLSMKTGCQSVCTMVIWNPKCCSGYYGRDCLACPGGPRSPCSNHGQCDEDHLGNGTCACFPGFKGTACELCIDGHFGADCKACNCSEHGSCDEGPDGTGSCFCDEGWTGSRCENKLADGPVCLPACHAKAVCAKNNTCMCRPFYEGDGLTCTVADLCGFWNGGCSKNAKCSQKEEKVNCTCWKGYSGDGYVCSPVDPCVADDNGGCHEHAVCTMTGPNKKKCECKSNYIGDGLECELKVLTVDRCMLENGQCHSDAQCTDLHYQGEGCSLSTLSYRDLEHHLLDGRVLELQALINISHVQTHLGHTLNVKGVPSLQSPQTLASSGYVNDRYIIESDILASNGIIHVLHGPLKAPPPPPSSLHPAHKAGMGIGVLLLVILIMAGAFVAYHFYSQQSKPFQFHYFREDENEESSPSGSVPYISNPMYESAPAPAEHRPPEEGKDDKHQVVAGGSYDLLQDS